ncbi:MAG: hypothetical protein SNJ85_02650 [Cyanobacteriota bacterium]
MSIRSDLRRLISIDTPVHVTDRPLVFFPFNWSYRWRGPVSYWDPRYGGDWFF